jgi:D-alanyl-lipoteichoic acid acyltransferase DltB (MBOAT superfamily)
MCFYKYTDFLIFNLNLFGNTSYSSLKLALPLAISFYTFQQISYLTDCYRYKVEERNFLNYCIFVLFFPQLIAGPILRYGELSPQLAECKSKALNWLNVSTGLFVFGIGLFKKVVIADSFAVFANAGFDGGKALDFLHAWSASLSYTFQIYYDFSGYSDMAVGAALLFNIRLPINFNSPYKALNIQDFWQGWHITLSRWLRDYLYIPLGGNRKGSYRTLTNLLLTFIGAGIWHGAGWTFMVWGCLHGIVMVVHRIWQKFNIALPLVASWFITFFFINFAWVFFRAASLHDAFRVLEGMFGFDITTPTMITNVLKFNNYSDYLAVLALNGPLVGVIHAAIFILLFPLIVLFVPNSMELIRFTPYKGKLSFKANLITAVFLASLLFVSFLTFVGDVSPGQFIYFSF